MILLSKQQNDGQGFRELLAYPKGFSLEMEIEITKQFPKEEKSSLTDQIRRSSRSVCLNLGEGCRRRSCPAHFMSKVSDSDMENAGARGRLDFSYFCKYID